MHCMAAGWAQHGRSASTSFSRALTIRWSSTTSVLLVTRCLRCLAVRLLLLRNQNLPMQGRLSTPGSSEHAQGFPGTVNATITYSLTNDNELQVSRTAHARSRQLTKAYGAAVP